jgi:hypothetical protein
MVFRYVSERGHDGVVCVTQQPAPEFGAVRVPRELDVS